jgi:hypothetical protein
MDVQKNTYHIVLEWTTLQLYDALPCHFIVLLSVGRSKEHLRLLLKPPKILHPWPAPMACTVEVVVSNSHVPQGNIGRVLSCPIHCTIDLSPVYPTHETNDTLMFLADKFVFKHRTHK